MSSSRGAVPLLMLLVPAAVWLMLSRTDIGMTPDSVMYWSAAQTIHDEGVIGTPVPRDPGAVGAPRPPRAVIHAPNGAVRYPLTAWAPGYPIALAGVMQVTGASAITAARVFALLTLALLAAAILMAASGAVESTRATFAAALVASLPFVHTTVRMMWSDALFAALCFATLALAARAVSPMPSLPRLLLVAAAAALATYVRYTGPLIMSAVAVGAVMLALRKCSSGKALVWKTAAACVVFALLVLPLFARNLRLVGDLTGMHRPRADEPVAWFILSTAAAFARGFVPWVSGAVPGPRDTLLSGGIGILAWLVALAVIALAVRRSGGLRGSGMDPPPLPATLLLGIFAALYTGALLGLRVIWKVDFNTRMLLPAIAAAALLAVIAFERRLDDSQARPVNAVALAATALATILSVAAADRWQRWRGFNEAEYLDRPVARWANTVLTRSHPPLRLVTTGYLLHYLHLATNGAPLDQLPDVPSAELLAPAGMPALALVDPGARGFRCPAYRRAYLQALDALADSSYTGEGFRAWWLSRRSARRFDGDAGRLAELCTETND